MSSGKVKIRRLKLYDSMVGISIRHAPSELDIQRTICRALAERKVNLTFISTRHSTDVIRFFGCVGATDRDVLEKVTANILPGSDRRYRILPYVTLLSIFPHRSDIRLVSQLLQALFESNTPVHAMASSIAALTLVVDTDRIMDAVGRIEHLFDMPTKNHLI